MREDGEIDGTMSENAGNEGRTPKQNVAEWKGGGKDKRKPRPRVQGARWRKLDNTAKLMAAVSGEDLSNVFRFSAVLKDAVQPQILERALLDVLEEFPMFRVRLRRGFFWNYFETNNREPLVGQENTSPCKYIDPHASSQYLFRVSYYGRRINLEVFHALTDGMGAVLFIKRLTVRYLELAEAAGRAGSDEIAGADLDGNTESGGAGTDEAGAGKMRASVPEEREPGEAGTGAGEMRTDVPEERKPGASVPEVGAGEMRTDVSEEREPGADVPEAGRPEERRPEERRPEELGPRSDSAAEKNQQDVDGYLKHYKKRDKSQVKRRYDTHRAMAISGVRLPLDSQNIVHGYTDLGGLKALCRAQGVSITKYLAALLLWSLIQVYGKRRALERPAALNLPINLRSFFDSETMANFFAVTNISWPHKREPESFEEVLAEAGRQMDEKIVKSRLEETISYNVSNEKKWYVRIVPLFVKNMVMSRIFVRSSRAYTMTFSNLGPLVLEPKWEEKVEHFSVFIGVSRRQPLKCTLIAFKNQLCITFDSVIDDTALSDFFFGFLEKRGVSVERESNGVTDREHDKGTYPQVSYDKKRAWKIAGLFYLTLLTAAIVTGLVNLATYESVRSWWSVFAIAGIAYAAVTVRYSIFRRSSLAGILLVESLGAQMLLILIDFMTGFHGWSFNYAIPSFILFDVIAIVFLIVVNRLNWQSYFMYQIVITIFSFIPLIFWAAGWVTKPLMAVITTSLSVAVLIVTIILGDRSVKKELRRRFHF